MAPQFRGILLALLCISGVSAVGAAVPSDGTAFGGGDAGWSDWITILDGVMGGKSSGSVAIEDQGSLRFIGEINNDGGGFSSVGAYFDEPLDLSGYAGFLIAMDALPEGEIPLGLQFGLRDNGTFWTHIASMALKPSSSPGAVQEIFVPMDSFTRADWRGMRCSEPSTCKLNLASVVEMRLFVVFQEGPFELVLHSVAAVKHASDVDQTTPAVHMTAGNAMSFLQGTIQRGTSLYGKGYPELSAAIYEAALESVYTAGVLPAQMQETIPGALQKAGEGAASPEEHAWKLRRVVDMAMARVAGQPAPSEDMYPEMARGDWMK
mmetsp:Transcript_29391/g.82886  ORF Transcript_29391/g.82886 Transcript_29391/m.82886 type:complete len:321 (+) Transcript_29391:244-1206(+)|eukprot:CAMPEP_0117688626 /NCGR_PEP_ID=MMETSP0804-20121206/23954_1 /TAXON_ID=1074897 /ORGANISM="Tetraselmis astigmatica, Strain CCMP880" /LENGTH=320 /DNA_ID=CAMNT_0005501139 /DNA_START=178 /DNA_END=1140 /DNA_ORIENTATION=-